MSEMQVDTSIECLSNLIGIRMYGQADYMKALAQFSKR
jgi:hypothetical protein